MNTRARLNDVKALLTKAQAMLEVVIEAQPKQTPGKPPQPHYGQKVARQIWNVWDKLKVKEQFDANDAWRIVTGNTDPRKYRIDSFYSAILSKWAQEGYIKKTRAGRGQLPAIYKIPNLAATNTERD